MVRELSAGWGTCSRTVPLADRPLAISYCNSTIAVGLESGNIIILDAITGTQTGVFSGHNNCVRSVTFSSDGLLLASGGEDCTVRLWDIQTGGIVRTFSGHKHSVNSVSISADSTRIASGSADETCRVWDIQKGGCYHIEKHFYQVSHVIFFPTNPQNLMTISGITVRQWNVGGNMTGSSHIGSCIAFSLDGTQFALCNKSAVTVQDTKSKAITAEFCVGSETVGQCCFSPDGRLVAASAGSTVYVWDITSSVPCLIETFTWHTEGITPLAFSSPSILISAYRDNSIKFWQIGSLAIDPVEAGSQPATHPSAQVMSITLQAADGITITSDSDGMVKIWDIFTSHCKGSFQTPLKDTFPKRDAHLIDCGLIIVWYGEGEIHLWNAEKQEPLFEMATSNVEDLKISGDGSKVFCLHAWSIEAWSILTGQNIGRVKFEHLYFKSSLTVEGSRVWAYHHKLVWEGGDFEIPGSPVQLSKEPPNRLHPKGTILWDIGLSMVRDVASRKILFRLNAGLGMPADVQWIEKYLVICFRSGKVLVLDCSCVLLQ